MTTNRPNLKKKSNNDNLGNKFFFVKIDKQWKSILNPLNTKRQNWVKKTQKKDSIQSGLEWQTCTWGIKGKPTQIN